MHLRTDSWLVRWTYVFNDGHRPPAQTSLCAFVWRGFVLMPILVALMLTGAVALLILLVVNWPTTLTIVTILACVAVVAFSADRLDKRWRRRRIERTRLNLPPSVLKARYLAYKARVCPIIQFVDSGDRS